MKIALVGERLGAPPAACPPARVLPLANALAGLGHQVTVYARQDSAAPPADAPPADAAPGVTVEQVPAGPPEPLAAETLLPHIAALAGELAARWRRERPDVIHAHFWTSGLAALVGARDLGIPVVQTFGALGTEGPRPGGAFAGPRAAARLRLEAAIGRSAAAVLAAAAAERAALVRMGVPPASVTIVPPGVDVTRFRPGGPAAQRGQRRRLLMVSPPGETPGPAVALRALADVPDAELVIVTGAGPADPAGGPGDEALTRLARALGVQDRVAWTAAASEAEMPPLLRSADVLVHLTPSPRFAVVPVEAMACGTPVVAAQDATPGDAIIDGNTGFVVPPAAPAEVARRIRRLLASPMLLDGYGLAAASRARSRYCWERIGLETLGVYEALRTPRTPRTLEAAA